MKSPTEKGKITYDPLLFSPETYRQLQIAGVCILTVSQLMVLMLSNKYKNSVFTRTILNISISLKVNIF